MRKQLLLVVPLVERLGLVEALVALEADEPSAEERGRRLGELGLARPGRALDEDGLGEPVGEVHHAGQAVVGEVADGAEALSNLLDAKRNAAPPAPE